MSGTFTANSVSFQGMPNLGVPLVNGDRTIGLAWYRLIISIYNVTLAGLPTLPSGVSPSNPNSLTLAGVHSTTGDQSQQISNQGTIIAGNTVSIATLTDDVVVLQNEITALQARVTALEQKIDGMTVGSVDAGGPAPPTTTGFLNIRINSNSHRIALY